MLQSYEINLIRNCLIPINLQYDCNLIANFAASSKYDFDEKTFRNIMVHEMIHYYLYLNDRSECSAFSHFLRAPLEDSQLGLARNLSILPSRFT